MTARGWLACAVSFAVYLVPLVGPHAGSFIGQIVFGEIKNALDPRGGRDWDWIAADIGLALVAQIAFGLLVYWGLRRPSWLRGLVLVAPIPPAIVGLNLAYLVAIPSYFLIERDTMPERAAWPLECAARDVWMPALSSSRVIPRRAAVAPIWVVEVKPPHAYGLFELPGCAVKRLPLTQSANGHVTFVTAGGRALYTMIAPRTGRQTWSVFDVSSGSMTPLEVGEGQAPILSVDGRSAAWLRPVVGSTPPARLEVVILGIDAPDERVVDLSEVVPGGLLELMNADTTAGELMLARDLSEIVRIGLDGRVRGGVWQPEGVDPQPGTFRFLLDGWVAWDAHREQQPYRVAWSLPGGKGSHRVPKSRGITSLAVSPDGRWIALSLTSGLNIGSTQDAVYVLRASDGVEVFRKYFPKHTRSEVAFPGPGSFVYTDQGAVNVLRVP